jgi:RHS repeat-associated protein
MRVSSKAPVIALVAVLTFATFPSTGFAAPPGDCNGDGGVTAADIFYLINYLFVGGPAPIGSGDTNGDGMVTAADIFYLINYLFVGGPAPVNPAATLPPDPATVAPPVSQTEATDIFDATTFLHTGPNPIQTGVTPGTIERKRAAALRGKVTTRDNSALSGVKITVLNHPELGQTLSRLDGRFDLVVNGGGLLTVKYEKADYLPVQRQLDTPWQDYDYLPDVVMIPLDSQVTAIDLSAATPIQVAQGSPVTDVDGTRQATLLLTQGTTATTAGGTPLTNLHVRATEYTVGSNGPKAMPGLLPPTSGYTYAVEFSADEAPGQDVRFSKPVITYVDNFLNFPVGGIVPVGYYDRARAAWIPADNGRVIKLLSITDGMAALDTNGDGVADDAATLAALGVTDAERQKLAALYTAGQSLWRVPITHFSPWDCNWPYGPPSGARSPGLPLPQADLKLSDPKTPCGSIIECQNQVLGESVGIAGTPFSLNYRSDRAPGQKAAYTVEIPLSGASLPASLLRIDLEISVAGRQFAQSFPPAPNQRHSFTWDGKDAYGRTLQSAVPATVRVGDVYVGVYQTPAQQESSFAAASGVPGFSFTNNRATNEITFWQETRIRLGTFDFGPRGLGGWSLSPHHAYDPEAKILYQGDGTRRDAQAQMDSGITTVAGNGTLGFSGDGGPATQAALGYPIEVAVAPDGSLYFADNDNNRIRRVGPDGIITTVAGNGSGDFSGDGGPATQAGIGFQQGRFPTGLAVAPDGSLYIGDRFNNRIRRVGPDGIITTVAGNGISDFSGDGGPATQAALRNPSGVAVAPDGSLYIADYENHRVRRVGPDGIINTVAGSGISDFSGDGGPATLAALRNPSGLAVAPDGSLYFADGSNNRIRRVGPDGIITTVAGPVGGFSGDGGLATLAGISDLHGLAVAPDGSLYFAENNRIRRVGPDGIITTVAGTQPLIIPFAGDGGPATADGAISYPRAVAVAPDRSLYIADGSNRIRRVAPSMPGLSVGDLGIASQDGAELHIFSNNGRHLRTLNALTGSVRYQFGYDSAGRLASITDGDGNVTSIERDLAGNATAIVAPFGQRTTLTLDANGYLASIANPANETHRMTYTADGLLTAFTDPKGNSSAITYDTLGRLIKDQNAANGFWALTRTEQATGYSVSMTSALNRTTVQQTENLATGDQRRLEVAADGTTTETLIKTDGTRTETAPDGTITTTVAGPDPRFGMEAPLTKSLTLTLPSGLSLVATTERTVNLAQPSDVLSLVSETNRVTLNGKSFIAFYDAALRQHTLTSPLNRQSLVRTDVQGRVLLEQITGVAPSSYGYDPRGRPISLTQGSGATARIATRSYDAQGNVASFTDPLVRTWSFSYDAAGRATQQILPDGRAIQFTYDANGNLTSVTPPGRPGHAFAYTPVDLQAQYAPPAAGVPSPQTLYTWDLDKQLTRVTRPDAQMVNLAYDANRRLSSLATPTGVTTYAYHPASGNLTQITAPGVTLGYAYDGALPLTESWSGAVTGAVTRIYNNDFNLTGLSVNGAGVPYAYDLDSLLIQAGDLAITRSAANGFLTGTTLGATATSQSYNGFGELSQLGATQAGAALLDIQYTRDNAGRVTQHTETVAGQASTSAYSYDTAGRLTSVVKDGVSTTSTYDLNGNRLSHNGAAATYDDQDRLLTRGIYTYSYTANGELKTRTGNSQTTAYTYDVLGNLRTVTLPDGTIIEYIIDGRNRRIGKKVNSAVVQGLLYEGNLRPVAELDGSNAVVSRFVYATHVNVPDYVIKGGATYRILTDQLGSPRLVVNTATGQIAQRMDYDAFGNVLQDTSPGFQPFGYAGGLYDRDTKLIRFGARDYDPDTGRWSAKDPILFAGGDTNLYGYVGNDPMNQSDPYGFEGMSYWEIFKLGLRESWPIYKGVTKVTKVVGMVENAKKVSCDIENLKKDYSEKKRIEEGIRHLTDPSYDSMALLDRIPNQQMNAVGHAGDLAEDLYKAQLEFK